MLKPIHKLNGGRGATLCHTCSKIISEGLTGQLYCDEHGGERWKYYLERHDGSKHRGNRVQWIEWKENGQYKGEYPEPAIGRSLLLDYAYGNFTWMTTTVTEIIEETDDEIHFKTKNSEYTLKIYK